MSRTVVMFLALLANAAGQETERRKRDLEGEANWQPNPLKSSRSLSQESSSWAWLPCLRRPNGTPERTPATRLAHAARFTTQARRHGEAAAPAGARLADRHCRALAHPVHRRASAALPRPVQDAAPRVRCRDRHRRRRDPLLLVRLARHTDLPHGRLHLKRSNTRTPASAARRSERRRPRRRRRRRASEVSRRSPPGSLPKRISLLCAFCGCPRCSLGALSA